MFRFAARLSQILNKGDVPLTADEVSGLDHYDLELEDALSAGGGTNYWNIESDVLQVDETTLGAAVEVLIDPTNVGNAVVDVYDSGAGSSGVGLFANGIVGGTCTGDMTWSAGEDFVATGGQDVRVTGAYTAVVATTTNLDLQASSADIRLISSAGNITLTVFAGHYIKVGALPTSDPGVSGALYTVLGVLHVSP